MQYDYMVQRQYLRSVSMWFESSQSDYAKIAWKTHPEALSDPELEWVLKDIQEFVRKKEIEYKTSVLHESEFTEKITFIKVSLTKLRGRLESLVEEFNRRMANGKI